MKKILLGFLLGLTMIGCRPDPCEEIGNIECASGDVDNDGVVNSEDSAPEDPCIPAPNNLNCPTGDFDEDGVSNSEDSDPEDPCKPDPNHLNCPTGDFDGDGTTNSEDPDPEDPCVPNALPLPENIIGTWSWSASGNVGKIKFNEDGTYEDIESVILESGNIVERTWTTQADTLTLKVTNSQGGGASIDLDTQSATCDIIVFDWIVRIILERE